ncbi:tyrosine--tRNA ligase [Patescibacteria group bacterium]|nr:tyrosine--tRNA ligase [Patescibacteria group bacterium]
MITIDENKINEILERGIIADILPTKKELKERLMSGDKLRFYIGADPTAKALHLGHAQNLMLLENFRKLGHEVIFLIGDFTGMIGDPTDKGAARVRQTREDVENNFKGWLEQTKNILSFEDKENPVLVKYNSEWLGKLNFAEVLELASNFTVQQMLERDMFDKRMKENKPIHVHEFMYPLMQGYDSVAMDVDVELCGTDQIFNALAGRTLLRKLKNKEKFVVSANLIQDEKTGMLMSKSNGTGVFLDLNSNDLYGAIMSQPDGMIRPLALGCTQISLDYIEEMMGLENPRDAKMKLAFEITKIYHGEEKAKEAEENFKTQFQKNEIPENIEEFEVKEGEGILTVLNQIGFVTSNGEARRKVTEKAVKLDGESVEDPTYTIEKGEKIIKLGRKIAKLIIK